MAILVRYRPRVLLLALAFVQALALGSGLEAAPPGEAAPLKPPPPIAFLALDIPAELHPALEDLQARLLATGEAIRPSPPAKFHITLRFLGHPEQNRLEALLPSLREVVVRHRPFSLELAGVGSFPFRRSRAPRVLWAGLAAASPPLQALADDLEVAVREAGFEAADHPFRAHLTLGRLRRPPRGLALAEVLEELREVPLGRLPVERVWLYQTSPEVPGGGYQPVANLSLGGAR